MAVEAGRHKGTPREKRACTSCSSGQIEDETHFMLFCEKFANDRKFFLERVEGIIPEFSLLSSNENVCFLLKEPLLNNLVAEYLYNIYHLRS